MGLCLDISEALLRMAPYGCNFFTLFTACGCKSQASTVSTELSSSKLFTPTAPTLKKSLNLRQGVLVKMPIEGAIIVIIFNFQQIVNHLYENDFIFIPNSFKFIPFFHIKMVNIILEAEI